MAICKECGDEFSDARKALGYDTCLSCGEEDAQAEVEKKRMRIGVAYSKGCYQYITSVEMIKDLGRK